MDEHLVGYDAVQASTCFNSGSEMDVKEASKQERGFDKKKM